MDSEEQAEIEGKIHGMEEAGAAGLRDWAAIRAHLKRHDDEMIGDFEDDINTMLVFAGLFSAVVTAFIIDSYKWLQPDNSQTTVQLLMHISDQIANMSSSAQVARAFRPALAIAHVGGGGSQFSPTAASVWINILWVLSLLIALTAALLGIIIKQWLREYLLWDSVLFRSREAVLLRHIRYDAWERWKVPLIISAVPAMLELALVMFLCGAATLLWTLNLAVAVVITFFGSLAFFAAVAVNILPVFFHRCPYKSAVGWTCVSAWNLGRKLSRKLFNRLNRAVHFRDVRPRGPRRSSSWRQRDLERHMQWGMPIQWELHPQLDEDKQLETVELVILFHALAWVCTSTQDDRLLAKVRQCANNFQGTSRKHLCLIAGMHAVCQIFLLNPTKFFETIRDEYKHQTTDAKSDLGPYGTYTLAPRTRLHPDNDIWQGHPPEQAALQMVADVLLSVAQTCIDDLFPTLMTATSSPSAEQMTALIETLCFLLHISRRVSPTWRDEYVNTLVGFYRNLCNADFGSPWVSMSDSGTRYRGFKATVFQLLARTGTVRIDNTGDIFVNRHEIAPAGHYAELAMEIFDKDQAYSKTEERHLFVVVADEAIRLSSHSNKRSVREKDALRDLFSCMDEAVEISLTQRIHNCGFHGHLPWLDSLVNFVIRIDRSDLGLIPNALLDNLERCLEEDLLAGDHVLLRISQLKALVADRWQGHGPPGSSKRPPRLPRIVESPETSYFDHGHSMGSTQTHHRQDTSISSTTGLLASTSYSPTTPYSYSASSTGDRDIELGVLPFPSPGSPNSVTQLMGHIRNSSSQSS